MLKALDKVKTQKDAISIFEDNLAKQEGNITEIGEKEVTQELRKNFNELKSGSGRFNQLSGNKEHPSARLSI